MWKNTITESDKLPGFQMNVPGVMKPDQARRGKKPADNNQAVFNDHRCLCLTRFWK